MKKLASLLLALLICTMFIPLAAVSAQTEQVRLAGPTRFDTMKKISAAGWEKSSSVVIVNGLNYADALTAVTLAKKYDAPILLTTGYLLENDITEEIIRLGTRNIIIVGGPGVIPESFAVRLRLFGKVTRYCGGDRYSTSANVAKALGEYDTAVVVTGDGYADALSVGPYAAIKGYPILYCNPSTGLTDAVRACIEGKNIIAIGGPATVPGKFLPKGFTRIAGLDRYQTSYKIAKTFESMFGSSVVLATGTNFPDALAGGALCAKIGAPMLLTDRVAVNADMKKWIKMRSPDKLYVIGGEGTISNALVNNIFK